jgi:hypothetical protein
MTMMFSSLFSVSAMFGENFSRGEHEVTIPAKVSPGIVDKLWHENRSNSGSRH